MEREVDADVSGHLTKGQRARAARAYTGEAWGHENRVG